MNGRNDGSAPNVFTVSGLGFLGDTFTLSGVRSNQWIFISEVTFATKGTGSVPEPASWALMLGGFGLTGMAMRRRTRKTSLA